MKMGTRELVQGEAWEGSAGGPEAVDMTGCRGRRGTRISVAHAG